MTVTHLPTRYTIGGSDAAAAAGVHPYESRVAAWYYKKHPGKRPESETMLWGTLLEPVIVNVLQNQGYEIADEPLELRDLEHPWRVGHPDRAMTIDGAPALLETKTVNQWAHREWNGGVSVQYEAQLQHYFGLNGYEVGMLAALVAGQRLEVHVVERNDRLIERLYEYEEEFYGFLVRDEPPPPDSSESAREAVAAMFPEHVPGRVMRLDGTQMRRLRELRARREQRDTIDAQVRGLENELKAALGDAETAISPHDEPVIHWRTTFTTRLDVQRLKAEMPDVYERHVNRGRTRRFVLA